MKWYYSKNDTQLGPVEQSEIVAKIAAGEVAAGDLVWCEGMADWLPCGQVGELWLAAASLRPPMAGEPLERREFSPYQPPRAAMAAPAPSSGRAIASLVLGIVATVTGVTSLLCCMGWLVAIPCGILAVVFGHQVRRSALTDPTLAVELGKVKAGIITGWVGLGLSALWLVFFAVMFVIGSVSR